MVVDLYGVLVDEFGRTHDAFFRRPRFHVFHHKSDEAVALGFDAVHHFFTVHCDAVFIQMDAEGVGMQGVMACFGRGNQQLGRHTADAGAGCAESMVFD